MCLVDCPYCEGDGEIFARERVRYNSIDPPMKKCPVCKGTGQLTEEEATEVDVDESPEYYEGDDSTYWDAKYDYMKDEGLI